MNDKVFVKESFKILNGIAAFKDDSVDEVQNVEVYSKVNVDPWVEELQAEIERLKAENAELIERAKWNAREQRTHNEKMRNKLAKMKCLALLYKREMYFAKADKEYKMFCDNQSHLHEINNHHYEVADYEYRKTKDELKEKNNELRNNAKII